MAEAPQHLFVSEIERLESLMHDGHQGLYWDPDALDGKGSRIITHSMLKQFRKCPLCSYFKYVLRLKPKMLAKPLKRGTWVHALLEEYANGGDWEALHAKYTDQFNRLFDEEKDYYGDMPTEIYTIVKSYMWHYKRDVWKYVANEFTMETPFPDGTLYRCKVDMLIENAFGLWLGDRKTHKTLPDLSFRIRDSQSALYLWAARENGLPVQGFIWDYLRWKAPSVPKLLVKGDRISDSALDTDYPTFVTALKKYKAENPGVFQIRPKDREYAKYLQGQQYDYGKMQTSEHFRRDILEKSDELLDHVMMMNYHTALRMNTYDFSDINAIEMADPAPSMFGGCFYEDLHIAHIMGTNLTPIIKQNYIVGDPNDYYQDRAGEFEKGK